LAHKLDARRVAPPLHPGSWLGRLAGGLGR
jgi:hypothetical protein